MGNDLDVCCREVGVCLDKVCAKDAGKEFGRCDWILFGFDVDSVLHRIGSYDDAVVCVGVSGSC